jgi:hypothetical protein
MARVRSSVHRPLHDPNEQPPAAPHCQLKRACRAPQSSCAALLLLLLLLPQPHWQVYTVSWAQPHCCMHPHTQALSDTHRCMRSNL